MQLKVKKLLPEAKLPSYAHKTDAGLDLTAATINSEGEYIEYGTGIAVEIPDGHVGLIFPRSSISDKDLMLTNSVGVVDSGYRGEIKFRFKPVHASNGRNRFGPRSGYQYNVGDKIGQLIVIPIPRMEVQFVTELGKSDRGEGGFGSSGQ